MEAQAKAKKDKAAKEYANLFERRWVVCAPLPPRRPMMLIGMRPLMRRPSAYDLLHRQEVEREHRLDVLREQRHVAPDTVSGRIISHRPLHYGSGTCSVLRPKLPSFKLCPHLSAARGA
eukprot:3677398-Prymnesium_polylepis.1